MSLTPTKKNPRGKNTDPENRTDTMDFPVQEALIISKPFFLATRCGIQGLHWGKFHTEELIIMVRTWS
jgi:hypothetical protein